MTPREKEELDQLLRDLETYPDYHGGPATPSFNSCEVSAPHPQLTQLTSASQVSTPSSPVAPGHQLDRTPTSPLVTRGRSSIVKTPVNVVGSTIIVPPSVNVSSSPICPVAATIPQHYPKPVVISSLSPAVPSPKVTRSTTNTITKHAGGITSSPHLQPNANYASVTTGRSRSSPSPTRSCFKGTRILPGAKIGDQDDENRTGVYASTLGRKTLSRNEREELDELINTILDEVKFFPDVGTVKRQGGRPNGPGYQRSASFASSRGMVREGSPVSQLPTTSVAQTINAFENLTQQAQSQTASQSQRELHLRPSPVHPSRSSFRSASPRGRTRFTDHPTQYHPTLHQLSRHPSISSHHRSSVQRTPSSPAGVGRTTGISKTTVGGKYEDDRGEGVARLTLTGSGPSKPYHPPTQSAIDATGVLSHNQAVEPLPPHLLRRPTPYEPSPESRPFSYGVTSASPLIQRRRVHNESTAYIVENRPERPSNNNRPLNNPQSDVIYAVPRNRQLQIQTPKVNQQQKQQLSPSTQHHQQSNGSNLYDNPADLADYDDAKSEISIGSSLYDNPTLTWLERQQLRLRSKKESSDKTLQQQMFHSKRMMTELDQTVSDRKVL